MYQLPSPTLAEHLSERLDVKPSSLRAFKFWEPPSYDEINRVLDMVCQKLEVSRERIHFAIGIYDLKAYKPESKIAIRYDEWCCLIAIASKRMIFAESLGFSIPEQAVMNTDTFLSPTFSESKSFLGKGFTGLDRQDIYSMLGYDHYDLNSRLVNGNFLFYSLIMLYCGAKPEHLFKPVTRELGPNYQHQDKLFLTDIANQLNVRPETVSAYRNWRQPSVSEVRNVSLKASEKLGIQLSQLHSSLAVGDKTVRTWRAKSDEFPDTASSIKYGAWCSLIAIATGKVIFAKPLKIPIDDVLILNSKTYLPPTSQQICQFIGDRSLTALNVWELRRLLGYSEKYVYRLISKPDFHFYAALLMYCGVAPERIFVEH